MRASTLFGGGECRAPPQHKEWPATPRVTRGPRSDARACGCLGGECPSGPRVSRDPGRCGRLLLTGTRSHGANVVGRRWPMTRGIQDARDHLNRRCGLGDMASQRWRHQGAAAPGSPDCSRGHNSSKECPNGAYRVSIGIYSKSRCR